jgi:putative transcriptional regulator
MNKIKETLKNQGRTQKWIASKIDRSENTISLWCLNKIQPSLEDLYHIAELLNCEVADLLVKKNKLKEKK